MHKSFIVFILSLVLIAAVTPEARAQEEASITITNLQYPTHVVTGRNASVTFTVQYQSTNPYLLTYGFLVGIFDEDTKSVVMGTPTQNCHVPPQKGLAECGYRITGGSLDVVTGYSGSFDASFQVHFSVSKTYRLAAIVVLSPAPAMGYLEFYYQNYMYCSNGARYCGFSITASDQMYLGVMTDPNVPIIVNGALVSRGPVYALQLNPGTHTISVPPMVQVSNDKRLRFNKWADGSIEVNRTMNLQDDTILTAVYITEYRLSLISQAGAIGGGWYSLGSTASFSTPSRFLVWTIQGWYENGTLVTASNNDSIRMYEPHVLTARWTPDYLLIGIICIIALVLSILYYRRMRNI